MASTVNVYDNARSATAKADVDLETAVVKVLLTDNLYVPDFTAHKFLSDITHEVAGGGSGYARQQLTNQLLVNKIGRTSFISDPITFQAIGAPISARWMIFFVDTGVAATSILLWAVLLNSTPADVVIAANKTLTINPDSTNGWAYL